MSRLIVLLVFFFLLFSCKNKTTPYFKNDKDSTYTVQHSNSTLLDSIDTDSSAYVVSDFPDTVKAILYSTNHKLLSHFLHSYTTVKNNDTLFSFETFNQIMSNKVYSTDSSSNRTVFRKRSFNKREQIEYEKPEKDLKAIVSNEVWYAGKKYIEKKKSKYRSFD